MSDKRANYQKRVGLIANNHARMMALAVDSQFDPVTSVLLNDDASRREAILNAAANEPMFESLSDESKIAVISGIQSSVRDYERTYGELPRDEVMASAMATMENMMLLEGRSQEGTTGSMMLESIGQSLSTSEGVEVRSRMVGLVLPVLLETATLDAVTMMPAGANEVEIFKIYRRAGSNFGGYKKGDLIDQTTIGDYTSMRQRWAFPDTQQPDGTITEHVFNTATDLDNTSTTIPFRKGSTSLWVNRKQVCKESSYSGSTKFVGTAIVDSVEYTINVTLDHSAGKMTVTPTSALPEGVELHIDFEVDIESEPDFIPLIDHDMDSVTLRPTQNVVAANATIQAMFTMQREFSVDLKSLQLSSMRNTLAAEKSERHLRDIKFVTTNEITHNIYTPAGEDWQKVRERLHETFLQVSTKILRLTKTTGMTGMYVGSYAATILKSLGAPHFVAPANYRERNSIHYAGKLFGIWKVYQAPIILDENEVICYGRGANHSEAGYVAGDAIAATMYNHPIGKNLQARNTLYELAYADVHPFDGQDYFHRVLIVDEAPVDDTEETTTEEAAAE